jgi:hypothetical protein
MEKIEYDGQIFHQECFKCLKCKTRVILVNVAMIKGDLYCKNCFKKTFAERGKYDDFGDKNKSKWSASQSHSRGGSQDSGSSVGSLSDAPAKPEAKSPTLEPITEKLQPKKKESITAAPVVVKVETKEPVSPVKEVASPVSEEPTSPSSPVQEEAKVEVPVEEPVKTEEPAAVVQETPAEPVAEVPAEQPAEPVAETPAEQPVESAAS